MNCYIQSLSLCTDTVQNIGEQDSFYSFSLFWKMKLPAITLEGYKYYEKRRLAYRDRTPNPGLGAELGNVQ